MDTGPVPNVDKFRASHLPWNPEPADMDRFRVTLPWKPRRYWVQATGGQIPGVSFAVDSGTVCHGHFPGKAPLKPKWRLAPLIRLNFDEFNISRGALSDQSLN